MLPGGLPLLKIVSDNSLKLLLAPMSGTGVVAEMKKKKGTEAAVPKKVNAVKAGPKRKSAAKTPASNSKEESNLDSSAGADSQPQNIAGEPDEESQKTFSDFLSKTVEDMKAVTSANQSPPAS